MTHKPNSSAEAANYIAALEGKGETGQQLTDRLLAEWQTYKRNPECLHVADFQLIQERRKEGRPIPRWMLDHIHRCKFCHAFIESLPTE